MYTITVIKNVNIWVNACRSRQRTLYPGRVLVEGGGIAQSV
jgi:hypothetical protein